MKNIDNIRQLSILQRIFLPAMLKHRKHAGESGNGQYNAAMERTMASRKQGTNDLH